MAERDLVVRFIGDDRSLNQAFTRQERRTKQFEGRTAAVGANLRTAFAAAGITLGTATAFSQIEKAIGAASDLNEQVAKSRQIFGPASRAIEDWAQTTASSMGISERAALSATGTFGNLFRVIEVAPQQASEMSRTLVQLAADLASFNNASPEDVLVAIRSGLIGEAEPLRRYGVLLSEARVQQVAMAETGKRTASALTAQEKALARYQIILQDTQAAQGDFARTSEGLANQSRTLRANMDDLSADIGGLLVPALTDLARLANLGADALSRLAGINFPGGSDVGSLLGWVSGWKELNFLLDQINPKLEQAARVQFEPGKGAVGAGRGPFVPTVVVPEVKIDATAAEKRFAASIKGLQLKLEKAQLTPNLRDDLDVLREIDRRINRQIRAVGRTFELEQMRVRNLQQIRSLEGQIADDADAAAQSSRDAAAAERDRAAATREAARAAAEERRARAESLQFRKLGLTSTGEPRGPSVRNLRQRVGSLRRQIEGTILDTPKTDAQLDRISRVLSGRFGKVGRDVRFAILQMLNDIASALKSGSKDATRETERSMGEFTRGGIRSTEKLIKGLGLTPAQEATIRERNRGITRHGGIGAFGFALDDEKKAAAAADARDRKRDLPMGILRGDRGRRDDRDRRDDRGLPSGVTRGDRGRASRIVINGNVVVVADDPDAFMRELQKKSSRTSGSRRGRHGGVRLGLG